MTKNNFSAHIKIVTWGGDFLWGVGGIVAMVGEQKLVSGGSVVGTVVVGIKGDWWQWWIKISQGWC